MNDNISKKELVGEIRSLLSQLDIEKKKVIFLDSVPDVRWVNQTELLKCKLLPNLSFEMKRVKLYSKCVSKDELLAIRNELSSKVKKEKED